MNRRVTILILMLGLAGLLALNAFVWTDLQDIEHEAAFAAAPSPLPQPDPGRPVIRIGVVSRFAPNIIYAGYQPIIDYLNRSGTWSYELRLSTSYPDAVDRLRSGEVACSFLGAWITSRLGEDPGLEPLLAPLNERGSSEFHVILVTAGEDGPASLADLAGRSVALPAQQSWSGNWLQSVGLRSVGLTVADLDSLHHFDHHQTVAWQVLRGGFDAGVVKESVALKYQDAGLRFLASSAPFPGPPLVGNRNAPAAALAEIQRLLLALDPADPDDRAVLADWTPEFAWGFVAVDRETYRRAFAPGAKAVR